MKDDVKTAQDTGKTAQGTGKTAQDAVKTIQDAIISLISTDRFYANLLMLCKRHITDKVLTAGVNVKDGVINLYINPEWFCAQTLSVQTDVLKHEAAHVLGSHFARRDTTVSHKTWNIATDAAINEHLPELVAAIPDCVSVERMGEYYGITLDRKERAEYYLKAMKDNAGKGKDSKGNGPGTTVDDHSVWAEGDTNPNVVEATVRQAVKDAVKGLKAGEVPAEAQALISAGEATIDWRQQLRRFVSSAQDYLIESTRSKRNRRYGLIYSGRRIEPKLKLGVCVDTSGSVSNEMLAAFLSEMKAIYKTGVAEIVLIEADCVVQNVVEYKGESELPFSGRGGTAYQPALDKCKELGVDAAIYFGDADCADRPNKPKFPVLWAIAGGQDRPAAFGNLIRVESKRARAI